MTDPLICVDLAGNNDAGNWQGWIEAVQIGDVIQLEGGDLACSIPDARAVIIEGMSVQSHGYIPWHGNMAWDAVRVSLADAARLLEHLRRKHWTVIEGEATLFQAYDDGAPLEAALRKAIDE